MHTDEYEISLSREITVCRKKVNILQKSLSLMEKRFTMTTGTFVKEFSDGKRDNSNPDFISWFHDAEAHRIWHERLKQYEEIFFSMKV